MDVYRTIADNDGDFDGWEMGTETKLGSRVVREHRHSIDALLMLILMHARIE